MGNIQHIGRSVCSRVAWGRDGEWTDVYASLHALLEYADACELFSHRGHLVSAAPALLRSTEPHGAGVAGIPHPSQNPQWLNSHLRVVQASTG